MITIVWRRPLLATDVAELVTAPTSHVIAALVFLYYEFTLLALSVMQVALKEYDLERVTFSLMHCQQTFGTTHVPA